MSGRSGRAGRRERVLERDLSGTFTRAPWNVAHLLHTHARTYSHKTCCVMAAARRADLTLFYTEKRFDAPEFLSVFCAVDNEGLRDNQEVILQPLPQVPLV